MQRLRNIWEWVKVAAQTSMPVWVSRKTADGMVANATVNALWFVFVLLLVMVAVPLWLIVSIKVGIGVLF